MSLVGPTRLRPAPVASTSLVGPERNRPGPLAAGGGVSMAAQLYSMSADPVSDTHSLFDSYSVAADGWMTVGVTRGSTNQAPWQGVQFDLGVLRDVLGNDLTDLGRSAVVVVGLQIRNKANMAGMRVGCFLTDQASVPSTGGINVGVGGRVDDSAGFPFAAQAYIATGVLSGAFTSDFNDGHQVQSSLACGHNNLHQIGLNLLDDSSVSLGSGEYQTDILSIHQVDRVILSIVQIGTGDSGQARTIECRLSLGVFPSLTFFTDQGF